MVLCLMVCCGNKTGKSKCKGVKFSRVPSVVKNQGEFWEELTEDRRRKWISAISRDDLTEKVLENDRVCSEHFVSGKSAADWDKHNIGWVPALKLGRSKNQSKNPAAAAERAARTAERRKRIQASFQEERRKRIAKLNEPGETVEQMIRTANTGESLCNEDSVTTDSTFSNNDNTA